MLSAATWMDPEIIVLGEVSKKEKDKYHVTSGTYGIKTQHKWTYLQNRLREHRLVVAKWVGQGRLRVQD